MHTFYSQQIQLRTPLLFSVFVRGAVQGLAGTQSSNNLTIVPPPSQVLHTPDTLNSNESLSSYSETFYFTRGNMFLPVLDQGGQWTFAKEKEFIL